MARKFRIIKSREKYITSDKVIDNEIFIIQEFKRVWFKWKWVNFMAIAYAGFEVVWFYEEEKAKKYLKDLKNYHTEWK